VSEADRKKERKKEKAEKRKTPFVSLLDPSNSNQIGSKKKKNA